MMIVTREQAACPHQPPLQARGDGAQVCKCGVVVYWIGRQVPSPMDKHTPLNRLLNRMDLLADRWDDERSAELRELAAEFRKGEG